MGNPRYRSSNTRGEKPLIFVMGDGDSEKVYFEKLNQMLRNHRIKANKLSKSGWENVLKKCRGHKSNREVDLKHGDRLVIITDEDHRYDEGMIRTFQQACEKEGFELFLSNISFETWLLMHFETVTAPYEQNELEERLESHLGKPYRKSEGIPIKMPMVQMAIANADKLLHDGDNIDCFRTNPSTRVHMLVGELLDREV
ncbi:MAG: RloB family protein [archaeon]|nr:RloB family protein [archaeon]